MADTDIKPWVDAIDGGIFAISTWLEPSASDHKDIDWLETNAEQIIERLHVLREHVEAQGEDLAWRLDEQLAPTIGAKDGD